MDNNKELKVTLSEDKNNRFYRETVEAELGNTTLEKLLEDCWGLDEDCLENHVNAFKKLIELGIIEDELTAKSIVRYDRNFNRYEYVRSYYELSSEIIGDDCLWEETDIDSDEFYQFLLNEEDEDILEERLRKKGWYVLEGIAIGLDNEFI